MISNLRYDWAHRMFKKDLNDLKIEELQALDEFLHDLTHPTMALAETNTGELMYISNTGRIAQYYPSKINIPVYYPIDGYSTIAYNSTKTDSGKAMQLTHQMVARAFIPNPDPEIKTEVNHIDGNKQNNWYKNLEWCTPSENTLYSYKIGTSKPRRGEDSNFAIYTEAQIIKVCEYLSDPKYVRWTYDMIGEACGVKAWCVGAIFRKERWPHIAKKYNFLPRETDHLHDHIGENNPACVYPDTSVEEVCCILDERAKGNDKTSFEAIGKLTGVSAATVYSIWRGKSRVDISSKHYFYKVMCQNAS